jgi:hypothetical protein
MKNSSPGMNRSTYLGIQGEHNEPVHAILEQFVHGFLRERIPAFFVASKIKYVNEGWLRQDIQVKCGFFYHGHKQKHEARAPGEEKLRVNKTNRGKVKSCIKNIMAQVNNVFARNQTRQIQTLTSFDRLTSSAFPRKPWCPRLSS